MSLFAISFRIHKDATYDARWQSVNDAIMGERTGTHWSEPTSFFLIQTGKNSLQLASAINLNSSFDESKDLLIVINLDQNGYKVLGKCADADVHALMQARKLVVPAK